MVGHKVGGTRNAGVSSNPYINPYENTLPAGLPFENDGDRWGSNGFDAFKPNVGEFANGGDGSGRWAGLGTGAGSFNTVFGGPSSSFGGVGGGSLFGSGGSGYDNNGFARSGGSTQAPAQNGAAQPPLRSQTYIDARTTQSVGQEIAESKERVTVTARREDVPANQQWLFDDTPPNVRKNLDGSISFEADVQIRNWQGMQVTASRDPALQQQASNTSVLRGEQAHQYLDQARATSPLPSYGDVIAANRQRAAIARSDIGENVFDRSLLSVRRWMSGIRGDSRQIIDNASSPTEAAIGSGLYAVNSVSNAFVDGAVDTGRLVTSSNQRSGFAKGVRRLVNDPVGTVKDAWTAFRAQPRDDQLSQLGAGILTVGGSSTRLTRVISDADTPLAKFETGGRQRIRNSETIEGWEQAKIEYDRIRGDSLDIDAIAQNTGWSKSRVARIKNHLFFADHHLTGRVGRFDADPDIVNAWDRLQVGDHVTSDVSLLRHEIFEAKFEGIFKVDYVTAHRAANRSGRRWMEE